MENYSLSLFSKNEGQINKKQKNSSFLKCAENPETISFWGCALRAPNLRNSAGSFPTESNVGNPRAVHRSDRRRGLARSHPRPIPAVRCWIGRSERPCRVAACLRFDNFFLGASPLSLSPPPQVTSTPHPSPHLIPLFFPLDPAAI